MSAAFLPYGRTRIPVETAAMRLDLLDVEPRAAAADLDAPAIRDAIVRGFSGDGVEPAAPGARVLIVVSDATRATGSDRFLPPLLDVLEAGGAREFGFAVATGIHRAPRPGEVERIVGESIGRASAVDVHDPDDASRLIPLGRTRSGTPVRVNRVLREYDRVVLTGSVGFHYFAGFTGGRKAILPGLAARETLTRNHLRALRRDGSRHPGARAGRLDGNPVHRDMVEGTSLAPPAAVVNAVLGADGSLEEIFAGHWRRAHERACRRVRATRAVAATPRPLVIASAGGAPSDLNVIQAHKAFEAAFAALEPGGVFVLAAECPDGAGHADFLPWFRHGDEASFAAALRAGYVVYGQTARSWVRQARACRLVLVSSLSPEIVRQIGAIPAAGIGEALELARSWLPRDAAGWIVPHANRILVESVRSRPRRTAS